jgi:predicted GIY-YIG superfamily endonuclease
MKYIIYKISVGDYTYIGSTRDYVQRKQSHKSASKTKEFKVYQLIREAGGWDKCEMVPIEEFECEEQLQARIREEYWRREYNANMNSCRAHITEEERIEQKLEARKVWGKQVSVKHSCQCGGKYTTQNKTIHERTKKHLDYLERQNLTI